MVTSIILFKLKDKTEYAQLKENLKGMKGKIPQLESIRVEKDLHGDSAAFDAVMITEYESKKAFDEYAAHPVHVETAKVVLGLCEGTASVLYES